jgi:hypothetical protein
MSLTNFPEHWEGRVERNIKESQEALFIDSIPEIAFDIQAINGGDISEKNKINLPSTEFEVDVLVNNNTYPIDIQQYADGSIEITLDKIQTKATSLTDDQIIGTSYSEIDVVTKAHSEAITELKYNKAVHAMAPVANTAKTPVILTKGTGTEVTGERIVCTYDDLVNLKSACDNAVPKIPAKERMLVLCDDHWNDLLKDRKNFGDQLVNYNEGSPAPRIAGFMLHRFDKNPNYNATTKGKIPFGATATATQYEGSFVFIPSNIAKKTGMTRQYFGLASQNPTTQQNLLNYRHYFVCTPKRNQYMAALVSGTK